MSLTNEQCMYYNAIDCIVNQLIWIILLSHWISCCCCYCCFWCCCCARARSARLFCMSLLRISAQPKLCVCVICCYFHFKLTNSGHWMVRAGYRRPHIMCVVYLWRISENCVQLCIYWLPSTCYFTDSDSDCFFSLFFVSSYSVTEFRFPTKNKEWDVIGLLRLILNL